MDRLQSFHRVQHERNSGLHIEYARSVQPPFLDFARHLRQRTQPVDRIEMPEQQNRLPFRVTPGKIHLQMIAVPRLPMNLNLASQLLETRRQPHTQPIYRGLIVAGRLHLGHLTNGFHKRRSPLLEVAEIAHHTLRFLRLVRDLHEVRSRI